MSRPGERPPERVLVLTPTGRDAMMIEARLGAAGFACEICHDVDELLSALKVDAGAAVIAHEALHAGHAEALLEALEAQEPWSDLPVVLLTLPVSRRDLHAHSTDGLPARANVLLLQRPTSPPLLLSAVRSALRARRRQYQMRDLYRQLSRAVQLGETFIGILGHDLRTPLGAVRMGAEYMVRSADDASSLEVAGRMLRSADRMARMIDQLLDFAHFRQGGGIVLRPGTCDLGGIVAQIVQELGDAHPGARLDVSTAGDLGGRWDPDRIGQVVSNLVGNSVQHGTAGIPVAVELDGTACDAVRLTVANHGQIPGEALPTLFDPFKRTTRNNGDKGLGLGLYIARELVHAHGGTLELRTVGGMTLFEMTLPREATVA